jgi:putative addiction module CopG family antidote
MPAKRTIEVTLPEDLDRLVREKVASGAYRSESEVIRDGLRALQECDLGLDHWLQTEGVVRHDAHHADLSREISPERVLEELQEHIRMRSKATD